MRFACRCGRFLAESAIRCADHRDDSRYYGIRSEVEWDCSRCGTVRGEEWEPQIVVTATHVMPEMPHQTHRTAPLAPEQPAAAPEPHPTHDEPQEGA